MKNRLEPTKLPPHHHLPAQPRRFLPPRCARCPLVSTSPPFLCCQLTIRFPSCRQIPHRLLLLACRRSRFPPPPVCCCLISKRLSASFCCPPPPPSPHLSLLPLRPLQPLPHPTDTPSTSEPSPAPELRRLKDEKISTDRTITSPATQIPLSAPSLPMLRKTALSASAPPPRSPALLSATAPLLSVTTSSTPCHPIARSHFVASTTLTAAAVAATLPATPATAPFPSDTAPDLRGTPTRHIKAERVRSTR
jgi:hypothetical protein